MPDTEALSRQFETQNITEEKEVENTMRKEPTENKKEGKRKRHTKEVAGWKFSSWER